MNEYHIADARWWTKQLDSRAGHSRAGYSRAGHSRAGHLRAGRA